MQAGYRRAGVELGGRRKQKHLLYISQDFSVLALETFLSKDNSLLGGGGNTLGCSVASLVSTRLPVAPPVVTTQNVCKHCQMSPGGQNRCWLRTLM